MIKSAEGSAGLLHKNREAHSMERRSTDPKEKRIGCKAFGPL